jgi:hypothetical protein
VVGEGELGEDAGCLARPLPRLHAGECPVRVDADDDFSGKASPRLARDA